MTGRAPIHVVVIVIELDLPACRTLKEKRSALKPLLIAVQREFGCSAAELDRLDDPGRSVIGCALVSNDGRHAERVLQKVPRWIEGHRPDLEVVDSQVDRR